MAAIDSAYHYYLSTYGASDASRYDTHKKSQLRAVYNHIVKTNKDAPLYKIKHSKDMTKFAIDMKEHSRSIQNFIASLSDTGGSFESVFHKKIAQSSDEDSVRAEYIGQEAAADDSVHFDVEVRQLAAPQINQGQFLTPDDLTLRPGSYCFDLNTELNSYEFQYTVGTNDTNLKVQEKLARLINSSGTGIKAAICTNSTGQRALRLESKRTGLAANQRFLFEILPAPDPASIRAMNVLGIDRTTQQAQNSSFLLNGTEHASHSNTFTIDNAFQLTLNGQSHNGTAAQIGFKTNADAVADNVQALVNVYNNLIQLGHNYAATQETDKLLRDASALTRPYYNEFESYGLQIRDDGKISVDHNLLADTVSSHDAAECFSTLNHFKDDLDKMASNTAVNPFRYASKVLIAYKNPTKHYFPSPYITSVYSGMMMDHFC